MRSAQWAQGLFASLIIGLILGQLGRIPGLGFLATFTTDAYISGSATPVVGAAIGVAIAYGLKVHPLCIFACAASGAIGYTQGGPVGAYLAGVFAAEAGGFVAGKTRVDIIVIPATTIIVGGAVSTLCAPGINSVMAALREFIDWATLLSPIPMGIIVSVVVGLALTAPISSAALCAMIFTVPEGETAGLGLMLAAGAATAGCCAQMVGFAVTSFRENGWGGLISQGLGTSMIQISNILAHPAILIPPTLASAITGPLCTTVFQNEEPGLVDRHGHQRPGGPGRHLGRDGRRYPRMAADNQHGADTVDIAGCAVAALCRGTAPHGLDKNPAT